VTGYHAYIDVDSWIDHHILNVLGRNVDAIRLSGYFFKDRNKKIEFGPIWDFDRAMGTGKPDETDINYRSYNPREWLNQAGGDRGTDFFRYATHQWWGRLFEDVDFCALHRPGRSCDEPPSRPTTSSPSLMEWYPRSAKRNGATRSAGDLR
jgi:hypothetical protein